MRNITKKIKDVGDTSPDTYEMYDIIDAEDENGKAIKIKDNFRTVTVVKIEARIANITARLVDFQNLLAELKAIE
jgi:hypothetical protein